MNTKNLIKSIPVVGTMISNLRHKYLHWKFDLDRQLKKIFSGRKDLCVIQIGSNDGSTGDPVYSLLNSNPTWQALFVEPVPFLFERLTRNYSNNPRYKFENVAIDKQAGFSTFYYIDASAKNYVENLPSWYDQLGSFNPDHIKKHFGDTLNNFILTEKIPTISLSELFERNGVDKIDLLHIDTEGHDWIILSQLNFSKYYPEVILIEHKHLSEKATEELIGFIQDKYLITDMGGDYLCKRIN